MGVKRKQEPVEGPVKKKQKVEEQINNFLEESSGSESEDSDELNKEEEPMDDDFGGFVTAETDLTELGFGDEDEDNEDIAELEAQARAIEEDAAKRLVEANLELKEQLHDKILMAQESLEAMEAPNIEVIKERIENVLDVLRDFKNLRKEGRSRSDYLEQLRADMCTFYGYNEDLMEIFCDLFSPDELFEFIEASDQTRPLTIRTNTLKTRRKQLSTALKDRGVNLEPIGEWSNVGLKILASKVPIGATPEYLAGHYIRQSPSSFLPCIALDPKPHEKVIDMAAAPGGKTSYLAQLMKNTGLIVANDLKKSRCASIVGNLHRLGVSNAIIVNMDGRDMPKHYSGYNKVLLDAPCTGLGVISHDETIKQKRKKEDLWQLSRLQKELILAGIDLLEEKSGKAVLVYSTCSVSIEENEAVVAYALKKRFVRLVDTGIKFGNPGFTRHKEKRFPKDMNKTKRIYPHVHNMDGFFVAKMEKFQGGSRGVEEDSEDEETAPVTSEASDLGFNSGQDKKAVATEKKGEAEKPAKKQKQKTSKKKKDKKKKKHKKTNSRKKRPGKA